MATNLNALRNVRNSSCKMGPQQVFLLVLIEWIARCEFPTATKDELVAISDILFRLQTDLVSHDYSHWTYSPKEIVGKLEHDLAVCAAKACDAGDMLTDKACICIASAVNYYQQNLLK